MDSHRIRSIRRDSDCTREGVEYSPAYWDLILLEFQHAALEKEMELGLLYEQRNELHRRCRDNDRPGFRHMLPFVWVEKTGTDGVAREFQLPMKIGTAQYDRAMRKIEDEIAAVRHGR